MEKDNSKVRFVCDAENGTCDLSPEKEQLEEFPTEEIRGIVMGFSRSLRKKYCDGKEEQDDLFQTAQNISMCCDPTIPNIQPPEVTFDLISGMLGLGVFCNDEYVEILRKFWALLCYYRDKLVRSKKARSEDYLFYIDIENCFIFEFALYKELQNGIATRNLSAYAKRLNGIIDQLKEKLRAALNTDQQQRELEGLRAELNKFIQDTQKNFTALQQSSARNLDATEKLNEKISAKIEEEGETTRCVTVLEAAHYFGVSTRTINNWDAKTVKVPKFYLGRHLDIEVFKALGAGYKLQRQKKFDKNMITVSSDYMDRTESVEPECYDFDQDENQDQN